MPNENYFVGMVIHDPVPESELLNKLQEVTRPYNEQTREDKVYLCDITVDHLYSVINEMIEPKRIFERMMTTEFVPSNSDIQKEQERIMTMPLIDFIQKELRDAVGLVTYVSNDKIEFETDFNRKARFDTFHFGWPKQSVIRKRKDMVEVKDPNTGEIKKEEQEFVEQFMEETVWSRVYPDVDYAVSDVLQSPDRFLLPVYDANILKGNPNSREEAIVQLSFPDEIIDGDGIWHSRYDKMEESETMEEVLASKRAWDQEVIQILLKSIGKRVSFLQFHQ